MAKPRVFISSTFYDLKQIRVDIRGFIESMGYQAIDNNRGDIPYGKTEALEKYCYDEIQSVDILVAILGGRSGMKSSLNIEDEITITQAEIETARKHNRQLYIFIDKNVLSEYETYALNKELDIKYKYVDDIVIYRFIEKIKSININNVIHPFESSGDIIKYLREQFSGLFKKLLDNETRTRELNLIDSLERTTSNLESMVNYLHKANSDKTEDITHFLITRHPIVDWLRDKLNIPYNFYILGKRDLFELLSARKYKFQEGLSEGQSYVFEKQKEENKSEQIFINKNLFKRNDELDKEIFEPLDENQAKVLQVTYASDIDDLPF